MKIIYRHLFNNLILPLLYLITAFSLLFIIADLLENGVDFYRSKSSLNTIMNYYKFNIPSYITIIVPVCLLLSTLYSLNKLNRYGEIIAMRASGISISKIIRPYILIGIFFTIVMFFISEYFSNYSYQAQQLKKSDITLNSNIIKEIDYVNLDLRHYWYIEKFDTNSNMLEGVTLRKRRANGTDAEKISAKKAFWINNFWWFQEITIQEFDQYNSPLGMPKKLQIKEMRNLTEIPNDFLVEKNSEYLSISELINLTKTEFEGNRKLDYTITLNQKLTKPFFCLIAILISIPIGVNNNRSNPNISILISIGLFFTYYGLMFFSEYLARIQIISPVLGVWTITVIFFILGIYLIKKTN